MGKFENGHSKVGGRVLGTPNRRTRDVETILSEEGVDPIRMIAEIAQDLTNDPGLRLTALRELAQYVFPKRKALDQIALQAQQQKAASEMPTDELMGHALHASLEFEEESLRGLGRPCGRTDAKKSLIKKIEDL